MQRRIVEFSLSIKFVSVSLRVFNIQPNIMMYEWKRYVTNTTVKNGYIVWLPSIVCLCLGLSSSNVKYYRKCRTHFGRGGISCIHYSYDFTDIINVTRHFHYLSLFFVLLNVFLKRYRDIIRKGTTLTGKMNQFFNYEETFIKQTNVNTRNAKSNGAKWKTLKFYR